MLFRSRDTSGLIIAAKNDAAHQALAQQLQDHSLYREYEAVCVGAVREQAGTVDAPIARHPTDRKRMTVDRLRGKDARTHYTVLARFPGYTYIQCRLETGRTHQIRVHMSHIGHPLPGDFLYGTEEPHARRQLLHSYQLSFSHPIIGERMKFTQELPEDMQAYMADSQKTE